MSSEAANATARRGERAETKSAPAVIEAAPAKINLFLEITGRRADGFHDLYSLVAFADLGERIEAGPGEGFSLAVAGPFADETPAGKDNLVLAAARALGDRLGDGHGARIRLTKTLPVAAGLGGGSADAAAAIRALRKLWGVDLPETALFDLAISLGSDVPVCLAGRPAIVTGRGEALAPFWLPQCPAVIVNPGVGLDTAQVFGALGDRTFEDSATFVPVADSDALIASLRSRRNDLEAPASALAPEIVGVLDALRTQPGCRLARMSGSGASCFGLFADAPAAAVAARRIAEGRTGWWVAETVIGGTVGAR